MLSSVVGIRLDQTRINRHALAADETFLNAAGSGCLEQMTQQFALPETAMPVLREGGVVGNAVVQIKAAKPAIGEVQMHLFAQATLRPDAKTVPNQKHADQQFLIERRATGVAVEVREMRPDTRQINEPINRAQQVILRNVILQRELVEQCRLRFLLWSHHRQSLSTGRIKSATYPAIKDEFFNEIRPNRPFTQYRYAAVQPARSAVRCNYKNCEGRIHRLRYKR